MSRPIDVTEPHAGRSFMRRGETSIDCIIAGLPATVTDIPESRCIHRVHRKQPCCQRRVPGWYWCPDTCRDRQIGSFLQGAADGGDPRLDDLSQSQRTQRWRTFIT
eukprot:2283612-Rhodomonas_salina.1